MWARPPRGEGGGGPDAGFSLSRYLKGTSHIYVAPPRCFYLPLHRTIFISVYMHVHSASTGLRAIYTNACAFRFYRAEGYLIPMHVRSASIGLRDIYTNACAFRFYRAEDVEPRRERLVRRVERLDGGGVRQSEALLVN